MRWSWVSLWLMLLLGMAGGYLNGATERCEFNSTDPDDIRFIFSYFYNKLEYLKFDSEVGKFVGYTEFGEKEAEYFNNNPSILERYRNQKDRYCVPNARIWYSNVLSKSEAPYAVPSTAPSADGDRILVCSAYSFYPKNISLTWTNHRQPLHDSIISTELLPNADWTFQIHSQLDYSPSPGDQISCVIEHISLTEPLVLDYDGAVFDEDVFKVILGASALALGLLLSVTGLLCFCCKHLSTVKKP